MSESVCAQVDVSAGRTGGWSRLGSAVALLVLVGLSFAFHFQWGIRGDDLHYSFPQYLYNFSRLAEFDAPGWCPQAAGGFPWQGEHQHPFSPTMWLGYLITPAQFITIHDMTMIVLAGVMTYLLARRLGVSRAGAFVAGLLFIGSGPILDALREGYSGHLAGCCYIPLVAYCLLRLRSSPGPVWVIATSLAIAAYYCTAHFQVFFYAALWLTAWYVFLILARPERRGWALGAGVVAAVLFLAFSAADWMPRFGANPLMVPTPRLWLGAPLKNLGYSSVGPMGTPLNLLAKDLLYHGPRFSIAYVGMFAVVAGAAALLRPNRLVWFLLVSALLLFLMTLGGHSLLAMGAIKVVPGLGFMKKLERFFYVMNLPVTLLVGIGVTYISLLDVRGRVLFRVYWWRLALLVVGILLLCTASAVVALLILGGVPGAIWKQVWFLQPRESAFPWATLVSGLAAVVVIPLLLLSRGRGVRVVGVLVLALVCTISFQVEAAMPRDPFRHPYAGENVITAHLDADQTHFRVTTIQLCDRLIKGVPRRYLLRSHFFPINIEIATGKYCTPNGLTVFKLPRFAELVWHANGYPPELYGNQLNSSRYVFADPASRFLDYYNVKYVVVEEPVDAEQLELVEVATKGDYHEYLYRNRRVLPRAWFAPEYEVIEERRALWRRMEARGFDPLEVALLESEPAWPTISATSAQPASQPQRPVVSIVELRGDELVYRVAAPVDGILVLSENYCPGWEATVDEVPTDVVPAFYSLRGVPVRAGVHTVRLEFHSPLLHAGLATSGISIVGTLLLLVVGRTFQGERVTARSTDL